MKSHRIAVVLSMFFAISAQAGTYHCTQMEEFSADDFLRARTTVEIVETRDVTRQVPYGAHYDHVYSVDVRISSTLAGQSTLRNRFTTIATLVDVAYVVQSVKSQGLKISLFLDEPNDAYMEEFLSSGRKITTRLRCE